MEFGIIYKLGYSQCIIYRDYGKLDKAVVALKILCVIRYLCWPVFAN